MKLLSIDVGMKNLGICILCTESLNDLNKGILYWDVLTLDTNTVASLKKHLQSLEFDFCLIEKQPSRNIKMRTVEAMIQMFCCVNEKPYKSYSAKYKLSTQENKLKGKKNYSERKKQSIRVVSMIVKETDHNSNFQKHKKKDDLADSLLQALHYLDYEIPRLETSTVTKEVKYNARKPTVKQERYGYSINNVKWFLVNHSFEENQVNEKLNKFLKKHFVNLEKSYGQLQVDRFQKLNNFIGKNT